MGAGLDRILKAPTRADGYDDADSRILSARVAGDDHPRMVLTPAGFLVGDGTTAPAPAVDAVRAEAIFRVDSRALFDEGRMVDLAGGLLSTPPEPNPKIVGPDSFTGEAAIGRLSLTGGHVDGQWFTDLDVRWRCVVLPHHSRDDTTEWVEVLNLPFEGGVTDWLEPAMLFNEDGTVGVGVDWDKSVSDPGQWDPAGDVDLGGWEQGLVVADHRVTIVATTGVVTLWVDDVEIFSETLGAVTFDEPPDESEVLVGSANTGVLAIYSMTLLDGIDGDPIIEFDATDPTGWTAHSSGGAITTAPSRPAWAGYNAAVGTAPPHTFTAGTGAIGAEDSVTIACSFQPLGIILGSWFAVNLLTLLGGGEGWAFVNAVGFGVTNQVRMSDGTNTISASFGTLDQGVDVIQVAVLDRDLDELRTYVDGVLVATEDASTLGAVDVASPLEVFGANAWGYEAMIWDRALTDEEIAAL